ncbi:MAG: DUF6516 family protein [Anaerolineae bacterium]|nr:DUF6516 family protein [Anaerolineae bacterium]
MAGLNSLSDYEQFIYNLPNEYPSIKFSTLVLKRYGRYVGEVSGAIFFEKQLRLNVKELIDFRKERIKTYSYEVYLDRDKQYWYDDQPHPNDPTLQSTHPHHKHIPPDIKYHRVPAPGLSFTQPNLPFLIQEINDNFLV